LVYLSKYFCYLLYNFRALPLSLATTHGISFDFFSSRYLDVSVPWVRFPFGMTGLYPPGCPIRTSTDYRLCAPTRSLSQLTTSFFASQSQGIHHTPLIISSKLYLSCVMFFYYLILCIVHLFLMNSSSMSMIFAFLFLWRIRDSNP
jgi:hypothetical protein